VVEEIISSYLDKALIIGKALSDFCNSYILITFYIFGLITVDYEFVKVKCSNDSVECYSL